MNTRSWTSIAVSAIGMLILLMALAAIGALGALRVMYGHDIALEQAIEYAKVFPDTTSVLCEKYDKDANGRLECVVFRAQGNYVKLLCDGWTVFLHEGCSLELSK